jgi:pyruvate-formate lyase-activating enzyme
MVYFRLKTIVDENFQDYKNPSMMLATCQCNWKCLNELGLDKSICQNSSIFNLPSVEVSIDSIIDRYLTNQITHAIVIAGLEPMLQFDEVLEFIKKFRQESEDDIVIYTGYYPDEAKEKIEILKRYPNIIIKFGRFIPDRSKIYDDILGIELVSDNQFALKIS